MLHSVCGRGDVLLQYKSAEPERCFVIVGALEMCLYPLERKLAEFIGT